MAETDLILRFGVALAIGLLVGLQREHTFDKADEKQFAGVRTFALMGLLGCTAALAADTLSSPWPFVGMLIILGAFLTTTYFIDAWRGGRVGLTTEAAVILTTFAGALVYWNQVILAVALGVATTVLLSVKVEIQRVVRHITREDIYAILKFAVITAIILPVLPNQTFGPPPFNVLNPYEIWLLVVLISGISFIGYVLLKVAGAKTGISLIGLLGGLASSTAVTLSLTQRSQTDRIFAKSFALAITIAWTVMFARVLIIIAFLNITLVRVLWLPIIASVIAGLAYCVYLFFTQNVDQESQDITFSNPFELGSAIKFGLIFALILLLSKTAQVYLGNIGIYLSSFVSGLADADAIALSLAELSRGSSGVDLIVVARAIVVAVVANTLAKGGIVLAGGTPALRLAILPGFLLMIAVGITVVFFV